MRVIAVLILCFCGCVQNRYYITEKNKVSVDHEFSVKTKFDGVHYYHPKQTPTSFEFGYTYKLGR